MVDLEAIADAIAAAYGGLTPPANRGAIRSSSADPDAALGPTPAVTVWVDSGDLETGNGSRRGVLAWIVRFHYQETADLGREARAVLAWLPVLLDALRTSAQLGGLVARATVDGFTVGILAYGGREYAGVELRVTTVLSEAWTAAA